MKGRCRIIKEIAKLNKMLKSGKYEDKEIEIKGMLYSLNWVLNN